MTSNDTLFRKVKKVFKMAGILLILHINMFSPHSTWTASTSMAKSLHLPHDAIVDTGRWRSIKSHARHWAKPSKELQ